MLYSAKISHWVRARFQIPVSSIEPLKVLLLVVLVGEENTNALSFLNELEHIIEQRKAADASGSYVASLFRKGINKIAQKVGEEAVETVIEAKDTNDQLFLDESADLLFHYLILLQAKGFKLNDVVKTLASRNT